MIDSRSLDDLLPVVKKKTEAFLAACKAKGIDILIYSTYRDNESQDWIYAQGRTRPGKIVSNAKGGQSVHNYRCAFDFAPLKNGKPDWSDGALFAKVGVIAESVGLEWGGRWKSFPDLPHCQFLGGLSLADLQSGKRPQEK